METIKLIRINCYVCAKLVHGHCHRFIMIVWQCITSKSTSNMINNVPAPIHRAQGCRTIAYQSFTGFFVINIDYVYHLSGAMLWMNMITTTTALIVVVGFFLFNFFFYVHVHQCIWTSCDIDQCYNLTLSSRIDSIDWWLNRLILPIDPVRMLGDNKMGYVLWENFISTREKE